MPIVSAITAAVSTAVGSLTAAFSWAAVGKWALSAVASFGLSSWLNKRQLKKAESAANNPDTTRTQTFASGPAQYPLGRCMVGGVVVYWGENWNVPNTERFNRHNGGADDAHMVIALADGACDKIEGIRIGKDFFPVKFQDTDKKIYQRREQRDGDTDRILMGLPLELDPQTEAYFDVGANRWRERNSPTAPFLDEGNEDHAEQIRRAALSGSISIFPYLDASGAEDNYRSLREYTDDRNNPDIHGKAMPLADEWTTDHKMKGVAGVHVRLRQWTKHKIDQRVFRGGVPQISFLMRGMLITHPDPNASTGDITQWTDNAAAVRYWWHTQRRGIDKDAINRDAFVKAYKICDERIIPTKPTTWPGLTEEPEWAKDDTIWGFKKYSINGVLFSGDEPFTIEQDFDMQWQGVAVEDGGQFHYYPGSDTAEADVISVDCDTGVSLIRYGVAPAIDERINSVSITLDQSSYHQWEKHTIEEVKDAEKTDEVDLGFAFPSDIGTVRWINNPAQAYMLAIIALRRYRNSMTYQVELPPGDDTNPVKYLEMTPGIVYSLSVPSEGIYGKRVILSEKTITDEGTIQAVFMDSPADSFAPTYQLPPIAPPPPYIPTRLGSRPIKPTNLQVQTTARTSSDGSVHFQISASVDANPLRVVFRLTAGDLVITQEVNGSTHTFDVNVPKQQMEVAAFHIDASGLESIPVRLIFTPDYRRIIMPTPRWNDVLHFGSNIVMKFEPEEFTAAVSGVEIRYTRLDINTTAEIPVLTEETWATEGELLTTDTLQLVHGVVSTANAVAPKSGRYNLYARYLSNVSGAEPVRGPISALREITIDIPDDSVGPPDQTGFLGTMYNLDRWVSKVGNTSGETLLFPSHSPASSVRFDNWNGNVKDSAITTEPLPAWPFGRCVGYGQSLNNAHRSAETGLWTGSDATLYRTLPIDLGESKRVEVRAEVHAFSPGSVRSSSISFGGQTISQQRWKAGTPLPAVPFPTASGGEGQIVYSMAGLPAGLSFNQTSRIITGTPAINTASGNATYTAIDASNTMVSITFQWSVATSVTAPGIPNAVKVVSGVTSAVLSWAAGLVSSYHRVEISTDNANFTLVGYSFDNDITLPSLTASTTYYVRVRGENGGGNSQWSSVTFTTSEAVVLPTTPTGFQLLDVTNDRALLNWDAHPNDHTYDLRWKLQSENSFPSTNLKTNIKISTTSVQDLDENTAYHFQLRAENSAGHSAWSSSLSVTTLVESTDGPSFVSIEHISGVRPHLKITTNELPGETGTDISIRLIINDDRYDRRTHIMYFDEGPGPFLVYNVGIGRTYEIGIRKAFYPADGNNLRQLNRTSAWTYQTIVFTSVPPQPRPPGAQGNGVFYNQIALQMYQVLTATRYRIKYWEKSSPENVTSILLQGDAIPSNESSRILYVLKGLTELTTYGFTLQAYNAQGWGIDSETQEITTKEHFTTPLTIGGLEIYPINTSEAVCIWEADEQAVSYEIQTNTTPNISQSFLSGRDPEENIHLNTDKLYHVFGNLGWGTSYTMQIRGYNSRVPGGRASDYYGPWSLFPNITMPLETNPANRYHLASTTPLTLSQVANSRNISFSFTDTVDLTLHSFQIRFRERQSTTTGAVNNWQLIPNAVRNTHSSGSRTFTGTFDPGFSNRIWEVQVRAYVSQAGTWAAGFSDWGGDSTNGGFRNGRDQLTAIVPAIEQREESTVVDVEWNPLTQEFETPNGTTAGITENQFDIAINGLNLPFKKGDYTNRAPGGTPRYDGAGIFDASFETLDGSPLSTSQPEGYEWQGIRTRTGRIGIHTIRVPKKIVDTPNAGPYIGNGLSWGEFLLPGYYHQINSAVQIEDGAAFKFINVGGYTNVDTETTYYLASRYSPRNTYGSSTRRYFVYTNSNQAKAATADGVFDLQGPADAYASAVLSIDGFEARSLKTGDIITAQITRKDPYQLGVSGTTASYSVVPPESIPRPVSNTVRNLSHTINGKDVVFTWDALPRTTGVFSYEVSVIEDIPGSPLPSETEGGDPVTTRTTIEQDSTATTFTKTGGRNEHFTLRIRAYVGSFFGPALDYAYSPPVINTTVGKVYGLTADPVGDDVRVRWGQTDNATGYEISISEDNGNSWSQPNLVTGGTREHTYVSKAATDFNVRVRAFKGSSAPYIYSLSYSVLSWKADTDPASNVLEDITTLVAVARNGSVYLDWSEADDAEHYRIEYRVAGQNTWVLVQDDVADTSTQWQTNISDTVSGDFRVRAESETEVGGWTIVDYIAEDIYTFPAPSIYTTSQYTSISVFWFPISGATSYEVQYREGTSGTWLVHNNNETASPATRTGLTSGQTYQWRVRAKEGSNAGAWSTEHTTATLSCESLGSPTSFIVVPHTDKIRLSWNHVLGASGYEYECYVSNQPNTGYPGTATYKGTATTASPRADITLANLGNPAGSIYVRSRVRGLFADCQDTSWTDYTTIRWQPYGIIVAPDPMTITELGDAINVSVSLASLPSGNVSIAISEVSTGGSKGVLGRTLMTFTPSDWNAAQHFTISHRTDTNYVNDTGTIRFAPSGSGYGSANNKDVAVTWVDQGEPKFITSVNSVTMLETENETIDVRLNSIPSQDVTVAITSTDTSAFSVSPSSMTFTRANYQTNQTVTVSGIVDSDSNDDAGFVRLSASGGTYNNVTKLVEVNIDDPKQSIVTDVTGTSIDVNEGLTTTIKARLGKFPNGFATILASSSNVSGSTVSPAFLNFNNTNWNTFQSFTITGVEDADGSDTFSNITLSGGLEADEADDVVIRVKTIDSQNKNLVLSRPSISVNEGDTANITAKLTSAPDSGTITVRATSQNTSVATVNPATRTFTSSNFSAAQNFVVSGVSDTSLLNKTSSIQFRATGGGYSVTENIPVSVRNTTKPDLVLGTYTQTDIGTNATIPVKLATAPSGGSVTVRSVPTSTTGTISVVSGGDLTFTSANWNTFQNVVISGTASTTPSLAGANVIGSVAASASGGGYNGITKTISVSFTNTAPIGSGIFIHGEPSTIGEGHTNVPVIQVHPPGQYRMTASASPIGKVTLGWSSSNTTEQGLTGLPITAREDADSTDDVVTITLTATRITAQGGANIPDKSFTFTIDDNEVPAAGRAIVVGYRGNYTDITSLGTLLYPPPFTVYNYPVHVRLNRQPTSNVTISASLSTSRGIVLTPQTLTFTRSNWNVDQVVEISISTDSPRLVTQRLVLTPSGGGYDGTEIKNVSFFIAYGDHPAFYINGGTTQSVPEGESRTTDLRMRSQGGNAYTVTPSVSPPGALTFSSSSYSVVNGRVNNFTMTAPQDANQVSETATVTVTASRPSGGSYLLPPSFSFGVSIVDDDEKKLVYSFSGSTEEGGTRTINVKLHAAPTGDVTITPSFVQRLTDPYAPASLQTIDSLTPSSGTITTSTWQTGVSFAYKTFVSAHRWSSSRFPVVNFIASGGGYNDISTAATLLVYEVDGFEFKIKDVVDNGTSRTFGLEYKTDYALRAGEVWQFFVAVNVFQGTGTPRWYASRVVRGGGAHNTTFRSGQQNGFVLAQGEIAYILMYNMRSEENVVAQREYSSIPSSILSGTLSDNNNIIGAVSRAYNSITSSGSSGTSSGASASAEASEEISESSGGAPVIVEENTEGYRFVDPAVTSAAVRPYFDGYFDLKVWKTGEEIDAVQIPDVLGGAQPYTIQVSGLPEGVRYESGTNRIAGTPTQAAPHADFATIKVIDANGAFDERVFEWVIAMGVPSSWSDFNGGIGRENNPFQMECATKGNIRPFFYLHGGTNAEAIVNNDTNARNAVIWMQCPTTYPHIARLRGAAAPDYDLVVKIGNDFYFSDTPDDLEIIDASGHSGGALIGVYRYEETTTIDGLNNTGDPLILEWVPKIIDAPLSEAGGLGGAAQSPGGAIAYADAGSDTSVVPGSSLTDIYVLHRNATTGAWTRNATPLGSGWTNVGADARQICFEFHLKTWRNRAVRSINTSYRDT